MDTTGAPSRPPSEPSVRFWDQRGAHDEGGAIIHATPPTFRRRYALEIASLKRQRGTGRRAAADEVPF